MPQTPEQIAGAATVMSPETQGKTATPPHGIHPGPLTRVLAVVGLASADLALIGWATHYAVTNKHNLSFWAAAGCICSILVAALCGTAAANLIAVRKNK